MALVSTAWPDEPVPENGKSWLADFFGSVDENVPDAPQKFASFFTNDALVRTGAGPGYRPSRSVTLQRLFERGKIPGLWLGKTTWLAFRDNRIAFNGLGSCSISEV